CLVAQRRDSDALAALEKANVLEGTAVQDATAFINLATHYRDLGRIGDAFAVFERNLPSCPDAYALMGYALLLLLVGRFREGWTMQDFRWLNEPLRSLRELLPVPAWRGQHLQGKAV